MNQEVLTSRAAKSSVQIGYMPRLFLANFMKRYLLAAQNKEQFEFLTFLAIAQLNLRLYYYLNKPPQYKFEITTMSEALKILNNIRTLRAQARECTLETLEEMLEN